MNQVSKSSLRVARCLAAPVPVLQLITNSIGVNGGHITNHENGRQSCQHFRRRFSTAASNETRTTLDKKQEPEPTLMERTNKNIIQRIFEKYSMSKETNRILMAESLFQAATTQASDPRWFGPGRIGRDFRSYQALLTMHIWFIHKRLISDEVDPHTAALIQEELFDILWIDSANRMRAHGVNEMLINKNLAKVQQYSFMHMFHYDHCYTGDLLENPSDRLEALKMTIKTHVLLLPSLTDEIDGEKEESVVEEGFQKHVEHDDQAERIAWYIETQFQNIMHDLPESFFQKARIAWVDLPSFDHMIDGNTGKELPNQPIDPEDLLPLNWTKSIANDGSYYFWNLITREAQWDRPE
mmetsp:Transcript_4672/g.8822  ORF Transcript_4672/g.8822 Transcript_4672/m.8822 type:complete len:354 (+) Transcript_4672:126-1187(+)